MCQVHIGERLCKLEQLFERFVCRKTTTPEVLPDAPRSPTLVGTEETESKVAPSATSYDAQSIASFGTGIVSTAMLLFCPDMCSLG